MEKKMYETPEMEEVNIKVEGNLMQCDEYVTTSDSPCDDYCGDD